MVSYWYYCNYYYYYCKFVGCIVVGGIVVGGIGILVVVVGACIDEVLDVVV
jgi:hypothetical protein